MNPVNQILLRPSEVLFFRDGRPMGGSLAGHTVAWPSPDLTNLALHAALHRAELGDLQVHRRGRHGHYSEECDRQFGSLVTAGPFPVEGENNWFFPRPADAKNVASADITLRPVQQSETDRNMLRTSLPKPLKYAVGNQVAPSKDDLTERWLDQGAFQNYLASEGERTSPAKADYLRDDQVSDEEHQVGIGIDEQTGAQDGESFYSAHYLRLRSNIRLGLLASAAEGNGNPGQCRDLLEELLRSDPDQVVVGGQQRLCTAIRETLERELPLPTGQRSAFHELPHGKVAVKWTLLSPAIWPAIGEQAKSNPGRKLVSHTGGWLPNWVSSGDGQVQLKTEEIPRKEFKSRREWRQAITKLKAINAHLVAAIVPKPQDATGFALPDTDRHPGGAKSNHLAVPEGAVYYFEAENQEQAGFLADALNWHGATNGTEIRNRRSALLGEKGYGLGVCSTWRFLEETKQNDS